MPWYPLNAAGLVYGADATTAQVLGTCAAYRSRDAWITAAHCIPDEGEVRVHPAVGPGQDERSYAQPATVVRHETIDLAILLLEPSPPSDYDDLAYKGVAGQLIDGGDFMGVGFPVEGVQNAPVPRMFKGHFMRYFAYEAPAGGYKYLAAEMSIPAPPGLSGGALSLPSEPEQVFAIVTTNVDSEVVLDRTEEVERDGTTYRDSIVRHISYGIAAMLIGQIGDWLDDVAVRSRPSG
jgi:Trypsin-like peptidase domain